MPIYSEAENSMGGFDVVFNDCFSMGREWYDPEFAVEWNIPRFVFGLHDDVKSIVGMDSPIKHDCVENGWGRLQLDVECGICGFEVDIRGCGEK